MAAKRRSRGPSFIKARLALSASCILAAFVLVYRSCLAGVFKEGAGLGLWGIVPSVCFLLAGIMSFQMLKSRAPLAFIMPAGLCLLADVTALARGAKAGEWKFWGILAAVLAVVYLLLLCLNKRKNLEAAYVFLGATVVLTVLLLIITGVKSDKTENSESGEQQENTDPEGGTEDSTVPVIPETIPEDGTLYLATDRFTITYKSHEVGEDVNGESCLYVYYDFTNRSGDPLSIPSVSYTKIIQGETECGKASVEEATEEMNNYKTVVDPGLTVTACEVYALKDMSDVEFQVIEFVAAGGKKASQILDL